MTTATLFEKFAADPMAPHSAQFPLARNTGPVELSVPSLPDVRPWGLAGMRPARQQGDPVRETYSYDHARQVAVDPVGFGIGAKEEAPPKPPTANSNTNNDGDEGPSEDWSYDFCPDAPIVI